MFGANAINLLLPAHTFHHVPPYTTKVHDVLTCYKSTNKWFLRKNQVIIRLSWMHFNRIFIFFFEWLGVRPGEQLESQSIFPDQSASVSLWLGVSWSLCSMWSGQPWIFDLVRGRRVSVAILNNWMTHGFPPNSFQPKVSAWAALFTKVLDQHVCKDWDF